MTDSLRISALSANTCIGIHAWEQRISQKLLLDITIPIDLSEFNDELESTLNYDALCQSITTLLESQAFGLIETVAEHVANHIKNTFNVNQLTVSVSKPHAVKNAGNICVTINR